LTTRTLSDTIFHVTRVRGERGDGEAAAGKDGEVIRGFLTGQPAAVEQVDGWLERAASSYRRRLRDQWEDVLQDVRLEVTRLLRDGKFRGESSLKTYLWRVTSHTCLDRLRAGKRWNWVELDPATVNGEIAAAFERPPEKVWSAERDLLLRVLAEMGEECRRLWRMLVDGFSYREMSDETGASEGALRVRVLRCRRKALEVRERLLAEGNA
jgi:RNA polymerase sigma factor (sigma-70 family)